MAILRHTCPHCSTSDAAFLVLNARMVPLVGRDDIAHWLASCAGTCPNCHFPIAFTLVNSNKISHNEMGQRLARYLQNPFGPEMAELEVSQTWPKPAEPSVPAHVPESIARAVLQAERNFPTNGNEEASAMMYRRSLELALKDKFPALTGTLASRIKQLVQRKELPQAMADWADEIRDLGNDAAHDPNVVERSQLTMIRGFTDATLRYLYTLPAEIEARRKLS